MSNLHRLSILLLLLIPLATHMISGYGSISSAMTLPLQRSDASSDPLSQGLVKVESSGEIELELDGATPASTYLIQFRGIARGSIVLALGSLTTDSEGDANTEFELAAGLYNGRFEVLRAALVQYLTAEASFVVSEEEQTTSVTSTTSTDHTTQTTPTTQGNEIVVEVEPSELSVEAGKEAEYHVIARTHEKASIGLSVAGVPDGAIAFFSPPFTRETTFEFKSKLHVVLGSAVAGTYLLRIFAIAGQHMDSTEASLTIVGNAGSSFGEDHKLELRLGTDRDVYGPGEQVTLMGSVQSRGHLAVEEARVSLEVLDDSGETVFVGLGETDSAGHFFLQFTLGADASNGVYHVFGVATKSGFEEDHARSSFVVGSANGPSIEISEIRITNQNGEEQNVFGPGETVVITVVVVNSGLRLINGMVWVQVIDPNGIPISITRVTATLQGTIELSVSIILSSNAAAGIYKVNAFVSDNLISKGGRFLASAKEEFAVRVET